MIWRRVGMGAPTFGQDPPPHKKHDKNEDYTFLQSPVRSRIDLFPLSRLEQCPLQVTICLLLFLSDCHLWRHHIFRRLAGQFLCRSFVGGEWRGRIGPLGGGLMVRGNARWVAIGRRRQTQTKLIQQIVWVGRGRGCRCCSLGGVGS